MKQKQKSELCKFIMMTDNYIEEQEKMLKLLKKQRQKAQEEADKK